MVSEQLKLRSATRQTFHDALRENLQARGLRLVAADLGRLGGRPVWVVTCEGTDGLVHRLQVAVNDPAYEAAPEVADEVARSLGMTG